MIAALLEFDHKNFAWLLLFLFPLVLLVFYQLKQHLLEKKQFGNSLVTAEKGVLLFKKIAPLIIFIALVISLMGPKGNPHYSEDEIKDKSLKVSAKENIVIVLDTSASMLAQDTPTKESRFSAAKDLADEIMKSPISAYYIFYALGSDYVKLVPRTLDKVFTRLVVNQSQINDGGAGTDFLLGAKTLNLDLMDLSVPTSIIYLTDGENPDLEGKPEKEKQARLEEIFKALFQDMPYTFPIYTVGFGSYEGSQVPGILYQGKPVISKLNPTLLKFLSSKTNGRMWVFNETGRTQIFEELTEALQNNAKNLLVESSGNSQQSLIWDHYFQWPLFLALLLGIIWALFPLRLTSKNSLLIPFFAVSLINQDIQILLEAGATEEVQSLIEQKLESSSTELTPWEKEALQFNLAVLLLNKGAFKEARERIESLAISKSSSPYVLEKMDQALALSYLGTSVESKRDDLKVFELFTALYSLRDAENNLCQLQKEKGYQDCTPGFITGELKKWGKGSIESHYEKFSEDDPLSQLAYGLEWLSRVQLVENNPQYYEAFAKELQSNFPPNFKDALNNFVQKDYSESLQFLKKENDNLVKKVSVIPLKDRVQRTLSRPLWTKFDLQAIGEKRVEIALKKLEEGNYLYARLMMLVLYQDLKRENFVNNTPIEVLENSIDEVNYLILLQLFTKEIKNFKEANLIDKAQENSLASLSLFLPQSFKFRDDQFLKKGCETAPWTQVMPLFEKGYNEQINSEAWLKEKKNSLALKSQTSSLKSLEEALKLLKSPPSSSPPPPSQSNESQSDTLRQFQDLEISDRELNKVSPTTPPVEKPW